MPIYPYQCQSCGESQDGFNHIDTRDTCPACSACGSPTTRQLSAPMVCIPGETRYVCPVTDAVVTSERQRRNIMAEHRLIDANDYKPEQRIADKRAKTAANQALAAQATQLPTEFRHQVADVC